MDDRDRTEFKRFVVLPALNNFNASSNTASVQLSKTLARIANTPQGGAAAEAEIACLPLEGAHRIVERIDQLASVVEMTEAQRLELTARFPSLLVREEVRLRLCRPSPLRARLRTARLPLRSFAKRIEVTVEDENGRPLKGVDVSVIFNLKRRTGIAGLTTNDRGLVEGQLPSRQTSIELITANSLGDYWPVHVTNVPSDENITRVRLQLVPIAEDVSDSLDTILPQLIGGSGKGVRVGIIDAGVSAPASLNISHGRNTTGSEPEALCDDNGSGHGTHVAGIIRRLAPEAEIRNYRAFEEGAEDASEAAISRAIAAATSDSCDLINLSLGQAAEAISITRELRRARALGTLCVAAAGNDYGGDVSFPAWSDHVIAITACGHSKSWPTGASMDLDVASDPAAQGDIFFAAFSNCGREVDFVMPGCGIVSWVSPGSRGVMSGTSMAAPAATGMLARLLSETPTLLGQAVPWDQARSDAIASLAGTRAKGIGLGAFYEGRGVIGL